MKTENLEILEFIVSGQSFGINVEQVNEILQYTPLTLVPNAHPYVEGLFMPRGETITAIDLRKCLNLGVSEKKGSFIVISNNDAKFALHADEIVTIHRAEDGFLFPIEETGVLQKDGYVENILKVGDKLIVELNIKNIFSDIHLEEQE